MVEEDRLIQPRNAKTHRRWRQWHWSTCSSDEATYVPIFTLLHSQELGPAFSLTPLEVTELRELFQIGSFVGTSVTKHFTNTCFTNESNQAVASSSKFLLPAIAFKQPSGVYSSKPASISAPLLHSRNSHALNHDEKPKKKKQCFTLSELVALRTAGKLETNGMDAGELERYLTPSEFSKAFDMEVSTFTSLPKWKQDRLKKKAGLF
uniref:HP domain-containing protein n=1 Tax=Octactis speculum TaxID=3111310 RepID=A0A7S2HQ22_9STRA